MATQEGKRIFKATGAVSGMGLITRLVGLVQARAIAHYFGTEVETSAFRTASLLFDQIFRVGEELLTHSVLPVFAQVRDQKDEKEAWKLASITANLQLLLLFMIAVVVYFGAPWIVKIYGAGASQQAYQLSVQLTRIVIPAVVVMGLSSLTYVILNAYKQFALPASGDVLFKLGIVVMILALCPGLPENKRIYVIAFGIVLGACGKLGIQLLGLWKYRHLYQFSLDLKFPPLKRLGQLMLPLIVGIVISKVRPIMDNRFAFQVSDSGPAVLMFARTLFDLPIQVIPYALGIALFPFLSDWAVRGETKRLADTFLSATRMMLFLFAPLTVGAIMLSGPAVSLLFQTGKFGEQSVLLTVPTFNFYALGMWTAAMEIIVNQLFFSLQDTKTPVIVGLWCVLAHLAFLYFNVNLLGMALGGIALALTLSKTLKVILLLFLVQKRLPEVTTRGLAVLLGQLSVAVLGMGMAMHYALRVVHPHLAGGHGKLANFGIPFLIGIIVFLVISWGFGIEEVKMVKRVIGRKLVKSDQ